MRIYTENKGGIHGWVFARLAEREWRIQLADLADFLRANPAIFGRSYRDFSPLSSPRFCVFYNCMNTFNTAVKILLTWARPTRVIFVWHYFKIRFLGIWPSGGRNLTWMDICNGSRPNTFRRLYKNSKTVYNSPNKNSTVWMPNKTIYSPSSVHASVNWAVETNRYGGLLASLSAL